MALVQSDYSVRTNHCIIGCNYSITSRANFPPSYLGVGVGGWIMLNFLIADAWLWYFFSLVGTEYDQVVFYFNLDEVILRAWIYSKPTCIISRAGILAEICNLLTVTLALTHLNLPLIAGYLCVCVCMPWFPACIIIHHSVLELWRFSMLCWANHSLEKQSAVTFWYLLRGWFFPSAPFIQYSEW